jgi:hypothetical protein
MGKPVQAGSQASLQERISNKIRARLDAGDLSLLRAPEMRATKGTGAACDACDEAIGPAQVQYQMAYGDGRTFHLHYGCAGPWEGELLRRGMGQQ